MDSQRPSLEEHLILRTRTGSGSEDVVPLYRGSKRLSGWSYYYQVVKNPLTSLIDEQHPKANVRLRVLWVKRPKNIIDCSCILGMLKDYITWLDFMLCHNTGCSISNCFFWECDCNGTFRHFDLQYDLCKAKRWTFWYLYLIFMN